MMLNMTRIATIPLVALLLQWSMALPGWGVEVGEPFPDFSIETFEGNNISYASVEGKPLLLIFWNPWCPNCMRELPEISRLCEKFGPYRYHFQDERSRLIFRYDNTQHFPGLKHFPHHKHLESEVTDCERPSIPEVIEEARRWLAA